MSIVNTERTLLDITNSDASMALRLFSGTVLEAFQLASVFYDRTNTFLAMKQITGGSSYQWPILGDDPASGYHNVGTQLNLQASQGTNVRRVEVAQRSVTVDEILVNSLDVGLNDLNVLHYDVLAPFATKLARNIARVLDRKIAILAVKAAATGAQNNIHDGGYRVCRSVGTASANASVSTTYPLGPQGAYNFRTDLATMAQGMDQKGVPDGSRYLFITPYIKTLLRFEANWTGSAVSANPILPSTYSRDLSAQPNDVNARVIGQLEGFNVLVTNNLPSTDLSVNNLTGEDAAVAYTSTTGTTTGKYQGKFDGTFNATAATNRAQGIPVAVALCGADTGSPAIGMVQAAGLSSYMENDERRNTKFLKAQIHCGLDILCPWSAGSIVAVGGNADTGVLA